MSEREETAVFCELASSTDVPVEGSVRHTAECGHEVWLSPSTVGLIIGGEIDYIYCAPCGFAVAAHDTEIIPPTEAQMAEIRRELARRRTRG